jgi:glutathione synthase
MSLTLAVVMDPIERVNVASDTSFAFMLAARARGHRVLHVDISGVTLEGGEVWLRGRDVDVFDRPGSHYKILGDAFLRARDCDTIFIRTDPPFDSRYLTLTLLLSFAERQGVWVVNSPRGLREANEHLYALEFPELCPPTMVTSSRKEARTFVEKIGGRGIGKPIDGHAGFGVVRLDTNDGNFNALCDMLSLEGKQPFMVQEFIPAVSKGDKRIIVIDGVARGAVRRVPQGGDHRGNVHVGARAEATDIEPREHTVVAKLAPRLKEDGLFFVGLDLIDGKLIEVNVTSPTLIREIHRFGGPDLATEVIEAVEKRAAANRNARTT